MTLADLQHRADAIWHGEYEHFAFDERVNYYTAVALLTREVTAIAWQPGDREAALAILAELPGTRTGGNS